MRLQHSHDRGDRLHDLVSFGSQSSLEADVMLVDVQSPRKGHHPDAVGRCCVAVKPLVTWDPKTVCVVLLRRPLRNHLRGGFQFGQDFPKRRVKVFSR